jgi:hypothetical protein
MIAGGVAGRDGEKEFVTIFNRFQNQVRELTHVSFRDIQTQRPTPQGP